METTDKVITQADMDLKRNILMAIQHMQDLLETKSRLPDQINQAIDSANELVEHACKQWDIEL